MGESGYPHTIRARLRSGNTRFDRPSSNLMCVKVEAKLGQVRSGLELTELGMFYLMALIIMPGSNPSSNGLKN